MYEFNWQRTFLARLAFSFLVIVGVGHFPSDSFAQTSFWTNASGDEQWNNDNNWTPTPPSGSRNVQFSVNGDIYLNSNALVGTILLLPDDDIHFIGSSNHQFRIGSSHQSRCFGSGSFSGLDVQIGGGILHVVGSLSVLDGTQWESQGSTAIGNQSDFGLVVVDGEDSELLTGSLTVGSDFYGAGALLIDNGGFVLARDGVFISPESTIGIHGGSRFSTGFDNIPLDSAPQIIGTDGSMVGVIQTIADVDFSTLGDHFDDDLDWTDVVLRNSRQMTGAALVDTAFDNFSPGEVDVPASPTLHFLGDVRNRNIVRQALDGVIQTAKSYQNDEHAISILRGQLIAGSQIRNGGTMLFDGNNTSLRGNVINHETGLLQTNANQRVTIHDEFWHEGLPFRTSSGATTVLAGPCCVAGNFSGDGLLIVADRFAPGKPRIATIEIEPNTIFGVNSVIEMEIASAVSSFDQLVFTKEVDLNGAIEVELIIYQAQQGDTFDLIKGADIRLGSGFSVVPPPNHSISHSVIDLGDGQEALRIEFTQVPGLTVLAPETIQVVRGDLVSGDIADLSDSDNVDVSIQRATQSAQGIIQFIVESTSPTPVPNELRLRIESSVFARTPIVLKIEIFNQDTFQYETLATEVATRFADSTFEHTFPGDGEQYLDENDAMQARITYSSQVNRQRFSARVDQIVWIVGD